MNTTKHHLPNRLRTVNVKFLGPTDHRGARVAITDLRQGARVVLPYCYETGCIYSQAVNYAETKGIAPDTWTLCLADDLPGYLLGTTNFETPLNK